MLVLNINKDDGVSIVQKFIAAFSKVVRERIVSREYKS
jgi:hypothetical protein